MADNSNYWKLQGTIRKLKEKDNSCFVCGSTINIVPHHLKQVNKSSNEYYDENNIVLLCNDHHYQYHRQYPDVSPKTFTEFLKKNHMKKPTLKRGRDLMNFTLDKELKISKLKRILKLITKTQTKVVKISVNGELFDISRVIDLEDVAIFELDKF